MANTSLFEIKFLHRKEGFGTKHVSVLINQLPSIPFRISFWHEGLQEASTGSASTYQRDSKELKDTQLTTLKNCKEIYIYISHWEPRLLFCKLSPLLNSIAVSQWHARNNECGWTFLRNTFPTKWEDLAKIDQPLDWEAFLHSDILLKKRHEQNTNTTNTNRNGRNKKTKGKASRMFQQAFPSFLDEKMIMVHINFNKSKENEHDPIKVQCNGFPMAAGYSFAWTVIFVPAIMGYILHMDVICGICIPLQGMLNFIAVFMSPKVRNAKRSSRRRGQAELSSWYEAFSTSKAYMMSRGRDANHGSRPTMMEFILPRRPTMHRNSSSSVSVFVSWFDHLWSCSIQDVFRHVILILIERSNLWWWRFEWINLVNVLWYSNSCRTNAHMPTSTNVK